MARSSKTIACRLRSSLRSLLGDKYLRQRLDECREGGVAGIPPRELVKLLRDAAVHAAGLLDEVMPPRAAIFNRRQQTNSRPKPSTSAA